MMLRIDLLIDDQESFSTRFFRYFYACIALRSISISGFTILTKTRYIFYFHTPYAFFSSHL